MDKIGKPLDSKKLDKLEKVCDLADLEIEDCDIAEIDDIVM